MYYPQSHSIIFTTAIELINVARLDNILSLQSFGQHHNTKLFIVNNPIFINIGLIQKILDLLILESLAKVLHYVRQFRAVDVAVPVLWCCDRCGHFVLSTTAETRMSFQGN